MRQETKTFTIVTFLCRGTRYEAIGERAQGVRFLDWLRSDISLSEARIAHIGEQIIRILRSRALAGSDVMRGFVNPYIFVIDEEEQIHLLDLSDTSNQPVVRKIQTASVMRYFTPEDWLDEDKERAEVYGFARMMQYVIDSSAQAGAGWPRAARIRWRRLLERCAGSGLRKIKDFDQAQKAFGAVRKREGKQPEKTTKARVRKPFLVAACLLFAVLVFKKGVYDQTASRQMLERDQLRMTNQLRELEDSVDDLRRDQDQLKRQVKNR